MPMTSRGRAGLCRILAFPPACRRPCKSASGDLSRSEQCTLAREPFRGYHPVLLPSSRRTRMSVQDRIESLREKHATLERAIDEEVHRPLPNHDAITDLKRQKLRIKDEIFQLERQ